MRVRARAVAQTDGYGNPGALRTPCCLQARQINLRRLGYSVPVKLLLSGYSVSLYRVAPFVSFFRHLRVSEAWPGCARRGRGTVCANNVDGLCLVRQ